MPEFNNRKVIRLQGLSFKEELMGEKFAFDDSPVYLALVPWEFCNWSCQYCHEDRRIKEEGELSLSEMDSVIEEAADLGVRSLLLLGGEVLLKSMWKVVERVVQKSFDSNLITLIYTNGSEISEGMARFLSDRNVSVALKVDSLEEAKYDRITQRKGSYAMTMRAIDILNRTSIGKIVCENESEKLVRLLFSTVGNALNVEEYISLARFATDHNARWMMESLNHRGDADRHPHLALDLKKHSEAMKWAMALNPEQDHDFRVPCRLLSCITIRKKGEIAICPQDYNFIGNIREIGGLKEAWQIINEKIKSSNWKQNWTGECPIKKKNRNTLEIKKP
jgi:MoaA/NifB/PqqE/SkfB family radical SAM enzyme